MRPRTGATYGVVVQHLERRHFLVERYVPTIGSRSVEGATRRLVDLADDATKHLFTVLLPDEETCLSVFVAPDQAAVKALNQRAGFDLDRIVEVQLFPASEPSTELEVSDDAFTDR